MNQSLSRSAKAELWKERISDYHASGLSVTVYCKQQHLSMSSFYYWNNKFNDAGMSLQKESEPVFLSLPITPDLFPDASSSSNHASVVLHISNNISLDIAEGCSKELLSTILASMQSYV